MRRTRRQPLPHARPLGSQATRKRGEYSIDPRAVKMNSQRQAAAKRRAFTAACARRATHEYAAIAGAGGPAFGMHASNQGRFMIVGGGLPIFCSGAIAGGVGCSSGTPEQDREVAQAGIDKLLVTLSAR